MAKIISNKKLNEEHFLLTIESENNAKMGQFYMLSLNNQKMMLPRPISIYDRTEKQLQFLIKIGGEGTKELSELKENDFIEIQDVCGNGFPQVAGKIALVGGGCGIAPMNLVLKELKAYDKSSEIDVYLGYGKEAFLVEGFKPLANEVIVNIGGYIIEDVDFNKYEYIFVCGPNIMMQKLHEKAKANNSNAKIYVSLEKRMACGTGICLCCSTKLKEGNKRVCKDGPVFLSDEVYYD